MSNPRLVILVASSDFSTDPRVYKQAITARDNGFDVTVCCYSHFSEYSDTIEDGCRIIRIPYAHLPLKFRDIKILPIINKLISIYKKRKQILDNTNSNISSHDISPTLDTYVWAIIFYIITQIYFYYWIIKVKADIYHSTDLVTLLTGVLLKFTNGGKLLYDSHEMWIESMENYSITLKKIVSVYENRLIQHTDAVTTVNTQIASELSKRYHIPLPTVAMNTPILQDSPEQISHENIRVIYQGRYTKNRGIENVVLTVPTIPGVTLYMRGIDVYSTGIGSTPYIDELKQIDSRVIFLPPVPMKELVQSLNEFDIGIVPYIGNNFNNTNASPNKTFEYMMAGLAVVASDLPVLREVIEKCNCGCTYISDDLQDLSRVITEMIPNIEKYKKNSRMWSEKEYNWDIQGKRIIDIYNKLLLTRP